MHHRSSIVGALVVGSCAGLAAAAPLTDSQLYFDPDSLAYGEYAERDIAAGDSTNWFSSPGREISGAKILPALKDNTYGPGYVYSQLDYHTMPGSGYAADLEGGILSATFNESGLFHVQVQFTDNTSETHAVYVDMGVVGTQGQDKRNQSGPTKKVATKTGDVAYISTGKADDKAMANAKTLFAGMTIVRVASVAELTADLATRSQAAGRKLDVLVVGHGFEGSIRLGKEGDPLAERINNTGNTRTTSGTDFGNAIKDYAKSVNLAGCSTGGGGADVGGRLLNDIVATGVPATAYTHTIYMGTSAMYVDARGTKVPAPGAAALMGLGGLLILRRRRG